MHAMSNGHQQYLA